MTELRTLTFERIHELGAERHPQEWFIATRVAVTNIWDTGLDISDPEVKRAVSLIVLRILDAVMPPQSQPLAEPRKHEGQVTP